MIDGLHLRKFKCHHRGNLALKQLTLLTGTNAGGKTSIIQGALLLSQALRVDDRSAKVSLNGERVRLGTSGDVFFQPHDKMIGESLGSERLELGFSAGKNSLIWKFKPSKSIYSLIEISEIETVIDGKRNLFSVKGHRRLESLMPRKALSAEIRLIIESLKSISYLSAERSGLRELFPAPDSADPLRGDVGSFGQYASWWLSQLSEEEADCARSINGDQIGTIRRQLNSWGEAIFPGFEANAITFERTGLAQLQLRTNLTEEYRKPANVGFGLSYAFPILVAGLSAKIDQILFIDSPEAHLHPRAQSMLGRFLAVIAASGVRVIIETHSDHILNGVRVAIKDRLLPSSEAAVYYFCQDIQKRSIVNASIDENGRVSNWPEGFFDQIETDLARL